MGYLINICKGSEIAEGGNVTFGFADINKLDYSSYTDALWEIVCQHCYSVSESWGLEYHKCEKALSAERKKNFKPPWTTLDFWTCKLCNKSSFNNDLDHLASVEHTIKEVNLLITNVDFIIWKYISALPKLY